VNRRTLLAGAAGAGLGGLSGCTDLILGTGCSAGDDAVRATYDDVMAMGDLGTVSVRGTIVDLGGVSLILADDTGYAELDAPFGKEFNDDWFSEGECVEVTATVPADYCREHGYLSLNLQSAENIEGVGDTNDPPDPPPETPFAVFDVRFEDGGVRLVHADGDPIPAGDLEVRHRPAEDLTVLTWADVAGVAPDAAVSEGDDVLFDRPGDGHLVWRGTDTWAEAVSSGWKL